MKDNPQQFVSPNVKMALPAELIAARSARCGFVTPSKVGPPFPGPPCATIALSKHDDPVSLSFFGPPSAWAKVCSQWAHREWEYKESGAEACMEESSRCPSEQCAMECRPFGLLLALGRPCAAQHRVFASELASRPIWLDPPLGGIGMMGYANCTRLEANMVSA